MPCKIGRQYCVIRHFFIERERQTGYTEIYLKQQIMEIIITYVIQPEAVYTGGNPASRRMMREDQQGHDIQRHFLNSRRCFFAIFIMLPEQKEDYEIDEEYVAKAYGLDVLIHVMGEAYIGIMTLVFNGEMSIDDLSTRKGKDRMEALFKQELKKPIQR